MSLDPITQAMHEWAAGRLGISIDLIEKVDFEVINGGHCETCEYSTFGASVKVTGQRNYQEIEEYDATQVIRDISEKVRLQTLKSTSGSGTLPEPSSHRRAV